MSATLNCLSASELVAFDQGRLPDDQLVAISSHLEVCQACRHRLVQEAPAVRFDDFLRKIRDLASDAEPTPVSDATQSYLPGARTLRTALPARKADGIPKTFGPYRILRKLGEGGMGVVYHAHDPRLKRDVALKLIKMANASPDARLRFLAEAEAVARVDHPNVIRIYELGDIGGAPFCALEYVPGGSLDHHIKHTLPEPGLAARMMIFIARGVQAAHDHGIVHRDLKPANILLANDSDGLLKVTDFGLAKLLDTDDSGLTQANAVMGTPSFMAPEQAEGRIEAVGRPADVWALGAILYDLLTGRPPFKGSSVRETLQMVIEQDPAPPRRLQGNVPKDLETICLKCLQKAPDKRYASAAALADDLQRFLNGEPITARSVSHLEKGWRWCRRKPALAGLMAFSVVALVGLLTGLFLYRDARQDRKIADSQAATDRAERQAAADREQAARELKRSSDYFAGLTQARERIAAREMGWTWAAADDLRQAAKIDTGNRNPTHLRTALVATLAGTDARPMPDLLVPGFHARCLTYHPNGRWLILAEDRLGGQAAFTGQPLRVLIVDFDTGKTVRELSYPAGLVGAVTAGKADKPESLAVGPDGRWLVLGMRGGNVHRWDLSSEAAERQTWVPDARAECKWLAFSPDGTALYAGSSRRIVTRWDTFAWKETARREECVNPLPDPLGRVVYAESHRTLVELDPVTLEQRTDFGRESAGLRAVSPSGRLAATSGTGKTLSLWDTRRRDLRVILREPYHEVTFENGVTSARFSPDGRLLAAANEFTNQMFLLDVATGRRVMEWTGPTGQFEFALHPSSRFLAVGSIAGTRVLEIGGQREHRMVASHPHTVPAADLSPDGRELAGIFYHLQSGGGWAAPALWNVDSLGVTEPFWEGDNYGKPGDWYSVAYSADGRQFTAVCDGQVRTFDRLGRNGVQIDLIQDQLERSVFGPDGRLWHTAANQVFASRPPPSGQQPAGWKYPWKNAFGGEAVRSLATGRQWAVVGGLDGGARVFSTTVPDDAATLTPVKEFWLTDRQNHLSAAAVSPDDHSALFGTDRGQGIVVSLPDGRERITWAAHRDKVTAARWLAPGLLATGGQDRTVKFWKWDGGTPEELWTWQAGAAVTSLGASSDGHRLSVTCAGERGVHLWDLAALNRRFAELGIEIEAPASWAVPRLPAPAALPAMPDPSGWPSNGLRQELFADDSLKALRVVRHVPNVYESWDVEPPHPHVPLTFSARWTGFLRPPKEGTYEFLVTGENGFQVWLDGRVVFDRWNVRRDGDVNERFEFRLEDRPAP